MALAVTMDVGESKTEQPSPDVAQTRPADRMTVPATRPAPRQARGARSTRPLALGVTQPLHRQLPLESTTVLVGPEGGWTNDELARARDRGIEACSMGPGILRAETAPLAALAAIRHSWGWR